MNDHGSVSLLTLELSLSGCRNLKQKRSTLQPLLIHLQREFNVSAAEVARMDESDSAVIWCAVVSNDGRHNQQVLSRVVNYISDHFPDIEILAHSIESR